MSQTAEMPTYLKRATELRQWIKENPGKLAMEMPDRNDPRGSMLEWLVRHRFVAVKGGGMEKRYYIKEL